MIFKRMHEHLQSEDDEEPLWIEWPTKKSVSGYVCVLYFSQAWS